MDKMIRILGALTIAVALLTGFMACSNEDMLDKTVEPQNIQVTVGAGFDDATTRSAVVDDNGNRKLTFTEGDRLFIMATITGTSKKLVGYLTIVPPVAAGATNASFRGSYASDASGDLKAYVFNNNDGWYYETNHTFANVDDIFSECESIKATLVHKDADGFKIDYNYFYESGYTNMVAPTVDELMTKCLPVLGNYSAGVFNLHTIPEDSHDDYLPIFNCSVTGLAPKATYAVMPVSGNSQYDLGTNFKSIGTVQTDADGKATFACCFTSFNYERYYIMRFYNLNPPYDRKRIDLGKKFLQSKIYNVSRETADEALYITFPTLTGASYTGVSSAGGHSYYIDGNGGALDFTLSGTSNNLKIRLNNYSTATVTLSSFNATADNVIISFNEKGKDARLVIDGDNTVIGGSNTVISSYGELKLSGNGTLTTKSNHEYSCGISAPNYKYNQNNGSNYYDTYTELDVTSQLAAPSYTVTRSERTKNGDRYTWVYTVAPNQ